MILHLLHKEEKDNPSLTQVNMRLAVTTHHAQQALNTPAVSVQLIVTTAMTCGVMSQVDKGSGVDNSVFFCKRALLTICEP